MTEIQKRLTIIIPGTPQPQGSKTVFQGRAVEQNKKLGPWRDAAVARIQEAMGPDWERFTGPVRLDALFLFARPKGHYGSGRNAGVLKGTAPRWKVSKPDADKLLRACDDALTEAGAWRDDSLLAHHRVSKQYCDNGRPATLLTLTEIIEHPRRMNGARIGTFTVYDEIGAVGYPEFGVVL